MNTQGAGETVTTRIPARMDRLPWSSWIWSPQPFSSAPRDRLETRFWGPGRLSRALREATRQGRVQRAGRRTYQAAKATR